MRGEHTQPRQRFAGAVCQREGRVLGEGHDPAFGRTRLETEAVRHRGRHQDGGRRRERQLRRFVGHLAAAALDQENLKQIAMPMRADGPVVNRGARCNRFNMNEVERLIVRRIAVKMKQGQRTGHAPSIGRSRRRRSRRCTNRRRFIQKNGSPPTGGPPLSNGSFSGPCRRAGRLVRPAPPCPGFCWPPWCCPPCPGLPWPPCCC